MNDYTKTPNYSLYKPTPNADDDVWGDHLNANADTLDGLLKRFDQRGSGGGVLLVTDYLPPGQPDGITDVAPYLQDAIDAAANADPNNRAAAPGFAQLVIQASLAPYIVGTSLYIPSNSHIVIAQGATLKLAPQTNCGMLYLVDNATNVLIELYGTLDGNTSQQSFMPNPTGSLLGTTISGGLNVNNRFLPSGISISGVCSHSKITGNRGGLITNFQNWPCSLTGATNCEISGISMTNCAFYAGSAQWVGFRYLNPAAIIGGTYTAATNIVTLTTSVAHGIVPGEEFVTTHMTGSSGSWQAATVHAFIALPGTTGTTLIYNGTGGGSDGVITGGSITNWSMPQASVMSGSYSPTNGIVTLTTSAPHYLNYDQMITANVTGPAAAAATGCFQLMDGTAGTTVCYFATKAGTTENIVSGTYDPATGIVVLITDVAHGLSAGDTVFVTAKVSSGFSSGINHEHAVTAVASSTQLQYTAPAHLDINGVAVVITGGTVYGGPTQTLGAGAICVSTKPLNSGFSDCYFDNIQDIGPCIYGGGINCYIRDCEVTRCASGPYLFSDANIGRCVGCEISGNYVHDNASSIGAVNFGPTPSALFNVAHLNTRIFNNFITKNGGGCGFGNCDSLDFFDNRLYANRAQGTNTYGSVGEVVVGPRADRVRITGNTLRDPCVLDNAFHGPIRLTVTSGTYDNTSGVVILHTDALGGNQLFTNCYFAFSNSTSSPASMSTALEGMWIGGAGTGGGDIHFNAPAGLGVFTITGGQVVPTGFGIAVHQANYVYVANNNIGDYQAVKTMLAAIGGQWGASGICTGNYYGPRLNNTGNFPADMSAGSRRSDNFDMQTGFTDGTTLTQPFSADLAETYPPLGISVGYNRSGGAGETDIYLGAGNASGGANFIKVKGLAVTSGTYVSSVLTIAATGNSYDTNTGQTILTTTVAHGFEVGGLISVSNITGTASNGVVTDLNGPQIITAVTPTTITFIDDTTNLGAVTVTGGNVNAAIVTLTTFTPHGLTVGTRFTLGSVLGFDTINPPGGPATNLRDINKLNGAWIATNDNAGTSGTTINFSITQGGLPLTGLDIQGIISGAINSSSMDGAIIDISVGLPIGMGTGLVPGGSLMAFDGLGNLRLSGALVHGAIQVATLANAGTVTVPQNTSFMLVQNASSLASGTVVMPSPMASSYQTIGSELTLRFQNAVGSLTFTGAAVAGAPTTVLSAGAAFRFIQGGPGAANTWLPCIPDVSGTPPVGGPYLPVSGGAVTGALTVNGMSTHTAGLTASGGGSVAGTYSGTPTWSGAHTFNAGITSFGGTFTSTLAANNTNLGRGNSYVLSGSTLDTTKMGLYAVNNISGTSTFGEVPAVAYIQSNSSNINATGLVDAMSIVMVTGGAAAQSAGWNALSVSSNDGVLATNDKAGGGAGVFMPLQLARRAAKNQGGTGLTPSTAFGGNWGCDIVNVAQAGATNIALQNGLEINQSVQAGASVMRRAGLQISSPPSHVVRGAMWDDGILIAMASGAAKLRHGIMFGSTLGTSPVDTDSGVITYQIGNDLTAVANIGLDFNDVTFTTASLRMPGGMSVSPTGALQLSTAFLTPTTTGLSVDVKGAVATGTPVITAGGTGYAGNEVMEDGLGGVYYVSGAAAGVVSSITVLVQPTYPTTTPPATLTLTSRAPGVGTGCVLTPTWSTTRTTLALNPSGGPVTFGGPVTLPAGTTGPFLPLATGGTVAGATTFSNGGTFSRGDGTPSIHVTGAAATFRTLRFETGGVARFSFGIDNSAESGTPTGTGSNFVISSFNDAGTAINSSFFQFNRLTGRTSMSALTQTVGILGSAIGGGNFAGFAQNAAVSGTGTTGGLIGFNQWNVSSDVAALTGQALFNTAINYNFGGAGFTGNRGGFLINMTQTGAAAGSSGAGGIEGLHVGVTVNNTFGGTGPGVGAQGAVFGANIYTRMASATSNLIGTCGLEIDVEANTGATYTAVTGLVVAPTLAHQAPGLTANNVAILVAGQTNSIGLDTAYGISGWALTSGGTLFRADFAPDRTAFNLGKGLDLRAITFANDIFAASGFAVGPTGRVRVGTGYFDTTATGAALSADGAICTGGTLTASVATAFPSDGNHYYADDPYGGLWAVAFASGTSSITAITLVLAGVVKGGPPANPVTLTPRDRLYIFSPGTITANLTWDTTRTTLSIQAAGGATTFGGTVGHATTATFGSGSNNILTITPGAAAGNAIVLSQSGTAGYLIAGATTVSGGGFICNSTIQAQTTLASGTAAGTSAGLTIQAAAGNARGITWNSGASGRWLMRVNQTTEGGSNAGSDFDLINYSDTAVPIFNPVLRITRSTGNAAFAASIGINGSAPPAKPTGWGTSTGGARAAITASSTLPQVAAGLAQLLNDLAAYGLIGV